MSNIDYILNYIYNKSPLQKKKIDLFIANRDDIYLDEFNSFLDLYIEYLEKNKLSIEYAIDEG